MITTFFKPIGKFFNTGNDKQNLFRIAFVIWFMCAVYLVITQYDAVYHLALTDTDDLMRYHQYTNWIKNGNWYLQPLAQFNPQDGVIMHWARLADIPLAFVAVLMSIFTDWQTAFTVANMIVPLIYMFIFMLMISFISYRLFNLETAKIAMLLPLLSPLSFRFLPGSLDHHNLQFILLSFFIFCFIDVSKTNQKACLAALAVSCSLWIGLENIYTFVIVLALLTIWGIFSDPVYLKFCRQLSLYCILFVSVCLILNRPINEVFDADFDAISFPFLICFVAAYIFCRLVTYSIERYPTHKLTVFILFGVLSFAPVILIYPNLIYGGYSDYPILLKENWLNNVSEARSLLTSMSKEPGKNVGYILAVLPTLFSPLLVKSKSRNFWLLYCTFCINYFLAFFWQIRMLSTALVCALPLQAYVCFLLREKAALAISKIIILFLSFPTVVIIFSMALFSPESGTVTSQTGEDNKYKNRFISTLNMLNKHNIHQSKILSSIDIGPAIIALTDNMAIAAPYHRNIRGNSEAISFFIADNNKTAKEILDRNNIDYVLIEENFFNTLSTVRDYENSIMDKLIKEKEFPDYLKFIDSNSTIKLYKYIKHNNE